MGFVASFIKRGTFANTIHFNIDPDDFFGDMGADEIFGATWISNVDDIVKLIDSHIKGMEKNNHKGYYLDNEEYY